MTKPTKKLLSLAALCAAAATAGAAITGTVFDDTNKNGLLDAGEKGIAGVAVSDQTHVVVTDKDGKYELPDAENVTVFISTPAEYDTPLDKSTAVPQFFKNIHLKDRGLFKANKAATSDVNFALYKRENPKGDFTMCVMADPQVPGPQQLDYYRNDVLDELPGQNFDFMVTLGDISGDAPKFLRTIAESQALVGIPNYGVIGNHDRNYDATNKEESSADFKLVFGPDYYSFNRGKCHLVVLNTVYFNNEGPKYGDGMYTEQLEWLKQDLSKVAKDKTVVLMMHIPVTAESGTEVFKGKQQLLDIIAEHGARTVALGGHWHTNSSYVYGPKEGYKGTAKFDMIIPPSVCGSWWGGPPDYRGVPLADQTDGTPNGYSSWTFDDKGEFKLTFKPANMSENFYARIYTPEMRVVDMPSTTVLANVFMAPWDAKVEMSLNNGQWTPMEKVNNMGDPYAASLFNGPYSKAPSWMGPSNFCRHLWRGDVGKLKSGLHNIRVRSTQADGKPLLQMRTFKF